jgi:hypothetical protein
LLGREEGLGEALRADFAPLAEHNGARGERVGNFADEDLTRAGGRLQLRRGVDRRPCHEALTRCFRPNCDVSCLDTHAHLEHRAAEAGRLAEAPGTDGEPGAHGPHSIVFVRLREPEDRHDGIAYVLFCLAARRGKFFGHGTVERS